MRKWYIGYNNYYFTSSIHLEEAPWYVFTLDLLIPLICDYFPPIPLPKINIIRDGEKTNLREYYGTTRDLFHLFICSKITDWCWNKTKKQFISFPYEKLNKMFPEDFKDYSDFDDDEKEKQIIEQNKIYSENVGKRFEVEYNNLCKISDDGLRQLKQEEKNNENKE